MSLVFVYLLDDRISDLCQTFRFAFEVLHGNVECLFCQSILLFIAEFFFSERSFHSQCLEQFHLTTFVVVILDCIRATVPDHIYDIHTDTFAHQSVATLGVNNGTLLVHHVIVFQQTFTDTEVVFFHLLLCTFDRVGDHLVLDHFAFLETEFVHYAGNTVGREQTHQVIFQ